MGHTDSVQANNVTDAAPAGAIGEAGSISGNNGFGSLSHDDMRVLRPVASSITDNFSISGTSQAATTDDAQGTESSKVMMDHAYIKETQPFGRLNSYDAPDGKQLMTFDPMTKDSTSINAPVMIGADGKIISNNSAGGTVAQGTEKAALGWGYEDGSSLSYRQGDSHMDYTDSKGVKSKVQLTAPFTWIG